MQGRQAVHRRPHRRVSSAALAFYGALAFLYFGLPVTAHPGRMIGRGTDADIFVWSFGWWAHALLHWENPIYTQAIWAPTGINLAWAATAPGVALLFMPVSLLAGPVAAYNIAAVAMPALAAWTAFLLCRYLTNAIWPSLVGGYVFGFSSYMLGHEEGHVHMTAVFLLPVVALVVLRYLDGGLDRRALALRLGLLLAAQLWFSTELFATVTLAVAVALVIAYRLVRSARRRLGLLVVPLAASYGIAAAFASPLLYYTLTDFPSSSVNPADGYTADLANVVVPTQLTEAGGAWASGFSAHFPGNEAEQSAYLGLPTLVILGLFLLRRRKEPAARFLLACFAIAVVAACGIALYVHGDRIVTLPWRLVAHLPVFNNVLPVRLMLFATLAAAVAVALWAASSDPPAWLRVALPALAVLAIAPNLSQKNAHWVRTPKQPSFFTHRAYENCIRAGDNVLIIPYGFTGDALIWQSESDFHFRMAGGDISPVIPAAFARYGTPVIRLLHDDIRQGDGGTILPLVRGAGVSTIIVDQTDPWPWATVLAGIAQPKRVGGMLLYPLQPGLVTDAGCVSD